MVMLRFKYKHFCVYSHCHQHLIKIWHIEPIDTEYKLWSNNISSMSDSADNMVCINNSQMPVRSYLAIPLIKQCNHPLLIRYLCLHCKRKRVLRDTLKHEMDHSTESDGNYDIPILSDHVNLRWICWIKMQGKTSMNDISNISKSRRNMKERKPIYWKTFCTLVWSNKNTYHATFYTYINCPILSTWHTKAEPGTCLNYLRSCFSSVRFSSILILRSISWAA
jgi:hypothetical protein